MFRFKLWWRELPEKICVWLAWKMPDRLVYWCAVRVGAHATGVGFNSHPDMTSVSVSLQRWLCK